MRRYSGRKDEQGNVAVETWRIGIGTKTDSNARPAKIHQGHGSRSREGRFPVLPSALYHYYESTTFFSLVLGAIPSHGIYADRH